MSRWAPANNSTPLIKQTSYGRIICEPVITRSAHAWHVHAVITVFPVTESILELPGCEPSQISGSHERLLRELIVLIKQWTKELKTHRWL